jgi:hypothetical protein
MVIINKLNGISNGILITTNQLGLHLEDTRFNLVFTLSSNITPKNTDKLITFIPKEEEEEEIKKETKEMKKRRGYKEFQLSFKKYTTYLKEKEGLNFFNL